MIEKIKGIIKKNKFLYKLAIIIFIPFKKKLFYNSETYWERRYSKGGKSGEGSYGKLANFKAEIINKVIKENNIKKVIEFGCGDGNQLSLLNCHSYIGLDVSKTAIKLCTGRFKKDKTKNFFLYNPHCFADNNQIFKGELGLSLDVIYHLTEYNIFEKYMKHLFSSSSKFVIIYSSNTNNNSKFQDPHIKHRCFSKWIKNNLLKWELIKIIKNKFSKESFADFYIYKKRTLRKLY